jgi:hypothetical protein
MMRLAFLVALVVVVGCNVVKFEAASSDAEAAGTSNGDACYLLDEHEHAPLDADCYVVTADEWSTLTECEGTEPQNVTLKLWGKAQEVSSFEVPAGGCFQYYECAASGSVAAPTVVPCE